MTIVGGLRIIDSNAQTGTMWWNWRIDKRWKHCNGLNENHNGLLRQFFPKRMALDNVSEKEAFRATDWLKQQR
jgi:IS30 family transposase